MADINPDRAYQIPDYVWVQIEPLLPSEIPKPRGGRPRIDQRKAMEAILYIFREGCKWTSLPRSMGSAGAVRRRFREWQEAGVFQRMWQAGILTYGEMRRMVWYGRKWRMPSKR
jgi:putative transposase